MDIFTLRLLPAKGHKEAAVQLIGSVIEQTLIVGRDMETVVFA